MRLNRREKNSWMVFLALMLLIGLWIFFAGATDRRLDGLLQTSVDHSQITDVSIKPLPKSEDSTNCNGERVQRFGKRAFFTAEQFDYQVAATLAAEQFEVEGWALQLSIPDPEGSIVNSWIVEAIREDEYVWASYGDLGNFSFIARINPCSAFGDQFTRLIVDEFPPVE